MPSSRFSRFRSHPLALLLVATLAILSISVIAWRTWSDYSAPSGEFDWSERGLSDFHNGTYLPTTAFRHGDSPYSPDVAERYGMARSVPPYSPVTFLVHLPFTLLDLHTADVVGFAITLALLMAMGWFGIRMSKRYFSPAANAIVTVEPTVELSSVEPIAENEAVGIWRQNLFMILGLTSLIVVSRPGHMTLFTGYFTAELALGTILAIHFARSRPVVSGLGMMLASAKPTFVLPLIFLMLCRRNFRALAWGIGFCTLAGVTGLAWLSAHVPGGLTEILDGIRAGQDALHGDVSEYPVNVWTRTDLVGIWAKFADAVPGDSVYLIAMMLIMAVPGFAVWRISGIESNGGATGLSGLIISLTILLAIYHHAYECLLLVIPWIGVTFYGQPKELGPRARIAVAVLLAIPAMNYASTISVRDKLGFEQTDFVWQLITAINTICLLTALVIAVVAALRMSASRMSASRMPAQTPAS